MRCGTRVRICLRTAQPASSVLEPERRLGGGDIADRSDSFGSAARVQRSLQRSLASSRRCGPSPTPATSAVPRTPVARPGSGRRVDDRSGAETVSQSFAADWLQSLHCRRPVVQVDILLRTPAIASTHTGVVLSPHDLAEWLSRCADDYSRPLVAFQPVSRHGTILMSMRTPRLSAIRTATSSVDGLPPLVTFATASVLCHSAERRRPPPGRRAR